MNREQRLEQKRIAGKKYYAANREKIAEKAAAAYPSERLRRIKYTAEWQRRNPEKVAARNLRWKKRNADRVRAMDRAWCARNKDKIKAKNLRNRTARRAGESDGSFSISSWKQMVEKLGGACLACGRLGLEITVDHIVPIKLGGKHSMSNVQPLCRSCNSRKGVRVICYLSCSES